MADELFDHWSAICRQASGFATDMSCRCSPAWTSLMRSVTKKFREQPPPQTLGACVRQEALHHSLIAVIGHAHDMAQRCPTAARKFLEETSKLCEQEWPNSEDSCRILDQEIEAFRSRIGTL